MLLRLQRTGLISCQNGAMQTLSWKLWYWAVNSQRGTKCAWNTRTLNHGVVMWGFSSWYSVGIYLFLYWRLFYLNKAIPTPASTVLPSSSSDLLAFLSGERSFSLKSSLMWLAEMGMPVKMAKADGLKRWLILPKIFFPPNDDSVIQRFCINKRDQWVKKWSSGK